MHRNFVLKGTVCYSQSPHALVTLPDAYLVCEEGVCAGVFAGWPEAYRAFPLTDCGTKLIVPGLIDLHVHAPQYAFRGLGMDLELLEWLAAHTFPEESKYRDLGYAREAYTAFVDALTRGPNTRACVFATCHLPATRLLMDLLEASGLVTLVGKVNMDRNAPDGLREASAENSLRDTRAWLEGIEKRYERTAPILTPRFIPSCTDELMRGIAAIQNEWGLPVQSHLSENPGEIAWVRELCPNAAFYGDAYDQFGLFGGDVPTVMAHCVGSDEREIERMSEKGVFVAHCPQSNANLSSGIAPVRRFLSRGLRVGLGSDVAGGCHTSIFRAMADAIQMSKLRWRLVDADDKALSLAEAFYLGTKGGGAFFGKVGSFETGYEFDALVIDDSALAAPFTLTPEERLARVVYSEGESRIVAKYARGRTVFAA